MKDLSHWDLVESLTVREAASLANGVDPSVEIDELDSQRRARVLTTQRALEDSASAAWSLAASIFEGQFPFLKGNEKISEIKVPENLFPLSEASKYLPSEVLIGMVMHKLAEPEQHLGFLDAAGLLAASPKAEPPFARDYLQAWFLGKGIEPVYRFSGAKPQADGATDTSAPPIQQSKIHPRAENNYLKIIAALVAYYSNEFPSAKEIERSANSIGAPVSDTTIGIAFRAARASASNWPD